MPVITGASFVSLTGNQLDISLTGTGENNVSITVAAITRRSAYAGGQTITDLQTVAPFSKVAIAV